MRENIKSEYGSLKKKKERKKERKKKVEFNC
jgi:hypothetical protein